MLRDRQSIERELLVLRCQRGDQTAWAALLTAWEQRLLYFIRQLVPSEADAWDALQQTWLRVYRGIGGLDDPQRLSAWLYRIARNTALSHARALAAYRAGLEREPTLPPVASVDHVFEHDNADAVHAALARLPPPQREALTLFFLENLTIDEIASVTEVAPGTVKSRLHYAKAALRTLLDA